MLKGQFHRLENNFKWHHPGKRILFFLTKHFTSCPTNTQSKGLLWFRFLKLLLLLLLFL